MLHDFAMQTFADDNVQELRHAVKAVEFKQHVVAAIAVFRF